MEAPRGGGPIRRGATDRSPVRASTPARVMGSGQLAAVNPLPPVGARIKLPRPLLNPVPEASPSFSGPLNPAHYAARRAAMLAYLTNRDPRVAAAQAASLAHHCVTAHASSMGVTNPNLLENSFPPSVGLWFASTSAIVAHMCSLSNFSMFDRRVNVDFCSVSTWATIAASEAPVSEWVAAERVVLAADQALLPENRGSPSPAYSLRAAAQVPVDARGVEAWLGADVPSALKKAGAGSLPYPSPPAGIMLPGSDLDKAWAAAAPVISSYVDIAVVLFSLLPPFLDHLGPVPLWRRGFFRWRLNQLYTQLRLVRSSAVSELTCPYWMRQYTGLETVARSLIDFFLYLMQVGTSLEQFGLGHRYFRKWTVVSTRYLSRHFPALRRL